MQVPYVIKVSTAKHFGHWQVGRITDPYLKGFTWSALAGSWMDNNSKIGQLLRTGYNRRDENILIDHLVNWDGTHKEKVFKRDYMHEAPSMLVDIPPEYHVPNDPSLTPWQLIKDVSRRYPDYILKVAQYGFPYEAESTLVFAHPLRLGLSLRVEQNSLAHARGRSEGLGSIFPGSERFRRFLLEAGF